MAEKLSKQYGLEDIILKCDCIKIDYKIGFGNFSNVCVAQVKTDDIPEANRNLLPLFTGSEVAVKIPKEVKSKKEFHKFFQEVFLLR